MQKPIKISHDHLSPRSLVDGQNKTARHVWKKLKKNGAFLIADKVGAGKSYIALSVAFGLWRARKEQHTPFRILILAGPSELSRAWLDKLAGTDAPTGEQGRLSHLFRRPGKKSYEEMYLRPALGESTPEIFIYSLRYKHDASLLKELLKPHSTFKAWLHRSSKIPRVEILVTSPGWIARLSKRGATKEWYQWCQSIDFIIADEIFAAKSPHTIYGTLLRYEKSYRAASPWARRRNRPWLLGLSATVLSRGLSDGRNLLTLLRDWASAQDFKDDEDLKGKIRAFAQIISRGLQKSDKEQKTAKYAYKDAKEELEYLYREYMVRTPAKHLRQHNFFAADIANREHTASVTAEGVTEKWPVLGNIDKILAPLQDQIIKISEDAADADKAVNALAWLVSASDFDETTNRQHSRFVESYPSKSASTVGFPHPKLNALTQWIQQFYRKAEKGWLNNKSEEFCFKLLIYVKHVDTARALNPLGRQGSVEKGKSISHSLKKNLERSMSETMKKIARSNHDLFIDGHLTHPCEAIQKCLIRLGWNTFEKLARQNRTLALAALVNANGGHSIQEKLKRFRKTIKEGPTHHPQYEQYIRVLARYPELRRNVLKEIHAGKINAYENSLSRRRKKGSLSLIVLDPKKIGLESIAGKIETALGKSPNGNAFKQLDKIVIQKNAASLKENIVAAQKTVLDLIKGDQNWQQRIVEASRAPKRALLKYLRLSVDGHRTPGVISVQTGADAKTRDHAMAAFRSVGNPYILLLTNIGTVGVDLHTYCWDVLHYTPAWTPHEAEQKTGRIDRPRIKGQLEKLQLGAAKNAQSIRVHYLIWPFTVDERIIARLNVRTILADCLLGSRNAQRLEEKEDEVVKRAQDYPPLDLGPSDQ